MKKLILILIFGCVFSREYIAIIDFEGIGVNEQEARSLTQRLTSEMIKLEVYQVLERSEMKRLLDEQKFQSSGCVNTQCAVDIGKILGAKYMVVGSVNKVGRTFSIDARMIDVETSESYISAIYDYTGEIDLLLKQGMAMVANQLCELEVNSIPLIDENKLIKKELIEIDSTKLERVAVERNNPQSSALLNVDFWYVVILFGLGISFVVFL